MNCKTQGWPLGTIRATERATTPNQAMQNALAQISAFTSAAAANSRALIKPDAEFKVSASADLQTSALMDAQMRVPLMLPHPERSSVHPKMS